MTFPNIRTWFILLATLATLNMAAQTTVDVVELKNGSILRGTIIEQVPSESLKLKTADGSVFVYPMDEVARITRETLTDPLEEKPDMSQYGGVFGLGVALGGGGIVGFPVRSYVAKNVVLEAGIFLRPSLVARRTTYYDGYGNLLGDDRDTRFTVTPFFAGGFDVMLGERYDKYDRKIVRNGIAIRGGTNLSAQVDESMFALGWVRERFNRERKSASYNMELGLGAVFYADEEDNPLSELDVNLSFLPMIYWKLHWNWYVVKRK
ncbi:MAG: hypothetical protein IPF78_06355 [Flavobacteriales bacterium]|nr:hypothetical protein [Flavobacteriales bacterium]